MKTLRRVAARMLVDSESRGANQRGASAERREGRIVNREIRTPGGEGHDVGGMGSGGPLRVLIVDDEEALARAVRHALEREGYQVAVCDTGAAAEKLAGSWRPDVILLDLGLPDADGRDVARRIRAEDRVPIIMVTGRGEEADRVVGLEIGADDYVVKPFSLAELVARVRAVARRATGALVAHGGALSFRDLTMDTVTYRVRRGSDDVPLTQKEFEVLRLLMQRPGAVVRRDEIVRAVWNATPAEAAKTLDVHMSSLRKKLDDDPKAPRYIETVHGVGFRLADRETEAE